MRCSATLAGSQPRLTGEMDIRNYFGGFGAKSKPKAQPADKGKSPTGSSRKGSKSQSKDSEKKRKKVVKISDSDDDDEFSNVNKKGSSKGKGASKRDQNGNEASKKINGTKSKKDEEIDTVCKKSNRSKKNTIIYDSESDEEPIPTKTKKISRREQIIISDSDEEIPMNSSIAKSFKKATPKKKTPQKKLPSPPQKKISAADFFGTTPIKQSEARTPSAKRKAEKSPEKNDSLTWDPELEVHDDEDFARTLQELDQPNKKAKLDDVGERPSLASKLAVKSKISPPSAPTTEKVKTEKRQKTPVKKKIEKPALNMEFTPKKKSPIKASSPPKISPGKPSKEQKPPSRTPPTKTQPTKTAPMNTPPPKTPPPKTPSPKTPKVSPAKAGNSPEGENDTPKLQRAGSAGYRSYLSREGPRALGSKEIPQGADNCLEGLTFVITGVLESMEREESKSLVEKYGGKVTGSLSKKTSYIVIGRDAGESKLAKANQFGTKQLDEDGLLNLIKTLPAIKSKYVIAAEKEAELAKKMESKITAKVTPVKVKPSDTSRSGSQSMKSGPANDTTTTTTNSSPEKSLLWVDKYKPTSLKQIIGQTGDKSNAKKLVSWLQNWHKNIASGKKPAFNRFSDDGSGHRAALLSGPPGVGKTTTATLVCQELGFSFVELNASDTRSKKSLQQEVAESLNNHTLVDFFGQSKKGLGSKASPDGHKHCLIMDEVDGMAGNEDRGGIQELVGLIKQTKIPIICMCNDRNHQKMRTLSNYCFDLRFQKPRLEQIKAAMMSMSFKEKIKVPPQALNEIILAANHDVRQVIHNLSMWSATDKVMTYESLKADSAKAKKDLKMGPFDVCRKVFVGGEETAGMSLNDKADLFFHDYSFGPLFVQENYINVTPRSAGGDVKKHLQALSRAADSLADGDVVDRCIRNGQKWHLLPLQAIYASVIPGEMMRGTIGGMIQFPSWLGKNSTRNKNIRLLTELQGHMRLQVSSDKRSLGQDYLPHLRVALTRPLAQKGQEGVPEVIELMDNYDLLREDLDAMLEVTQWPGRPEPMSKVESKVKAAFTRAYNKEAHLTPYATGNVGKKSRRATAAASAGDMEGMEGEGDEEAGSEEEKEEDPLADGMIKQKKKPAKGKRESVASTAKGGKGKGKGKGRGKGK